MIINKKIIFRKTLLDWPILIFLISQSLSLLFSIDPHVSWFGYYSRWNGGLLSLISYSLLYWAFVSNMDSKSSLRAVGCALWAAAVVAVYGSLEHFGASISCLLTTGSFNVTCWVQDVQNRVFATLGQPNWLAAYLVTLIFIPLSKPLNSKFLIFVLLFATLLFTKSRSGLLAFGISSLIYWGTLILSKRISLSKRIILTGVSFYLSHCHTYAGYFQSRPRLSSKTKDQRPTANQGTALETGGTESGAIRKIVWTGALRIWQANPKTFSSAPAPKPLPKVIISSVLSNTIKLPNGNSSTTKPTMNS